MPNRITVIVKLFIQVFIEPLHVYSNSGPKKYPLLQD